MERFRTILDSSAYSRGFLAIFSDTTPSPPSFSAIRFPYLESCRRRAGPARDIHPTLELATGRRRMWLVIPRNQPSGRGYKRSETADLASLPTRCVHTSGAAFWPERPHEYRCFIHPNGNWFDLTKGIWVHVLCWGYHSICINGS